MQRRLLAALLCFICAAALPGCDAGRLDDSFFPLARGHEWHYRVVTEWENGQTERENQRMSTLPPDIPAGFESMVGQLPAWRRRSDTGMDYWLRIDASGIFRVASKSDLQQEAQPDKPPRYVLKAPYSAGTQWQATTTPYLLMRNSEFPRELRHTHKSVPMNYVIEATGDSIDTPAGRFENCLRVKGTASLRVYADPTSGWRDLPLTTLEWYCPGVGLVRLERREPAHSPFLTGGTLTMELQSWH